MEGRKAELLQRIENDREVMLDFFRRFIRFSSPNPPGDTREAAGHIRQFLARHGADCRVVAPNEIMPNLMATFEAAKPAVTSRSTAISTSSRWAMGLAGRTTRGAPNSSMAASTGVVPAT